MSEFHFLRDLLILFGLGIASVVVSHRLRIPPIAGFMVVGMAAGPYGFGLIQIEQVQGLAEVGVILLLFTVGIEFSLRQLAHLRTILFGGGGLQVGLTIVLVMLAGRVAGLTTAVAAFVGMLVALSSTAIVIRLLADRGEVDSPHGRASLAICIFQDLCLVPMLLVAPLLSGASGGAREIVFALAKATVVVVLAIFLARTVVPRLLRMVVETRNREAFLLTIIFLCLGTAWLTSAAGLSLALGAFIAGLVISESEYSQQALGEILPFREVFNSLFFVSIGMLLDVRSVLASPVVVLGGILLVVAVKALATAGALLIVERSVRVAILAGLLMAQIGEFSFVLSRVGLAAGLLDERLNQLFLAIAIGTMAATPWLYRLGARLSVRIARTWSGLPGAHPELSPEAQHLNDHVIVVGFGINGRNVARVLKHVNIPFIVIELSPAGVRDAHQQGLPVLYGDASNVEILEHAGVRRARAVVLAISDAASTRRATDLVRRLNPAAHVIVRTRYVREVEPLYAAGAHDVVPEEFETSIEIFSRVLQRYLVPRDIIERCMWEVRLDGYDMFRSTHTGFATHRPLGNVNRFLSNVSMDVYRVEAGSRLAGKTLRDSQLREQTGAVVVAIERPGGEAMVPPPPDHLISPDDALLLLGRPQQLSEAAAFFVPSSTRSLASDGE